MGNLDISVRHIGNRYSAQLKDHGKIIDHMMCESKRDIGWICREMLRWFCKLGGDSKWARSARTRQNTSPPPAGKVWYGAGRKL